MTAALAEIAINFAGNSRLFLGNRLRDKLCLAEEIVKPPARHGVPASIDHDCCPYVIHGRNVAAARAGDCPPAYLKRSEQQLIQSFGSGDVLLLIASALISFARSSRASSVWGGSPAFSIDLKTA